MSDVLAHAVHKVHVENVWIRRPKSHPDQSLEVEYSIPPGRDAVRMVELIEVQRQVGMLHLRMTGAVHGDEVFLLDSIALQFQAPGAILPRGVVRCALAAATAVGGSHRVWRQRFEFASAGRLVATGSSQATIVPRRVYERLRARNAGGQMPALLAADEGVIEPLTVDMAERLNSDHLADHVTAVQIVAAVERVATRESAGLGVAELKVAFCEYVEVDLPADVVVVKSTSRIVRGTIQQGGSVRSRFRAKLWRPE